jgi:hypothetical protein
MIVEGERKDVRLMKKANELLGLDNHSIVSYNTNIYELYERLLGDIKKDSLEENNIACIDPDLDLLQVLKEREHEKEKLEILNGDYTDIVLIFDFDPQDNRYKKDVLLALLEFFTESTDKGRLYINYPMVEGLYHLRKLPDYSFKNRKVTKDELVLHKYKSRVNNESMYSQFSQYNTDVLSDIIKENLRKMNHVLTSHYCLKTVECDYQTLKQVAIEQTKMWDTDNECYVLGTCLFYYLENYPKMIMN